MKVLQYAHYLYLIIFVMFVYDAFERYQNNESYVLSLLFAALAVFMFFFRRKFSNRMGNK
ncbi:hypothetical protein [Flavobacterium sp.]|uniref:hypothetical protein n=1 Tax=Flavobacterium sp. TaxID=239 RepID=UPI0028BEEE93|nr:hypothetical protein [Flavobacterium sp.]